MATLPTLTFGAWNTGTYHEWDTVASGTAPILEAIGSAVDSDYYGNGVNSSGAYIEAFALHDTMPSDFSAMLTLSVRLRHFWVTSPTNMTWDLLDFSIGNAGVGIAYANYTTVASSFSTTPTDSSVIPLTLTASGLAATKAQWDSSEWLVRITKTRTKGGSTAVAAISAAELTGTYTAGLTVEPPYHNQAATVSVPTVNVATPSTTRRLLLRGTGGPR